jgi:hypothetical protein
MVEVFSDNVIRKGCAENVFYGCMVRRSSYEKIFSGHVDRKVGAENFFWHPACRSAQLKFRGCLMKVVQW